MTASKQAVIETLHEMAQRLFLMDTDHEQHLAEEIVEKTARIMQVEAEKIRHVPSFS